MRINQISSTDYNSSFKGAKTNAQMIRKLENVRGNLVFKLSIYPSSLIYSNPKLAELAEQLSNVEAAIKYLKAGKTID